jgi:predicted RNA-binding protein with PUA-like domain
MPKAKHFWLLKTEPGVFSFDDLVRAPKKTTAWEGVRNYQARNFLRDDFEVGDLCLIYHSNAEPTAIMGVAEVVRAGYADPSAIDPKSNSYDEKAHKRGENPWVMVDVNAIARLRNPLDRETLRSHRVLSSMMVLKKGTRLSIQPVTAEEFAEVWKMGDAEEI